MSLNPVLKKRFLVPMLVASSLAVGAAGSVTSAFAAGGGTSGATPNCKRHFAWDKNKRKCVKVKKSSNLSDENIYDVARNLAYGKRYGEAITLLKLAKNQNDPRILNYLGYSTRKSGDVKKGLTYYQAAIKADPNYTLARSYMGEAYLQLGDKKSALKQLSEIKARCTGSCPEYAVLEKQILGQKTKSTW